MMERCPCGFTQGPCISPSGNGDCVKDGRKSIAPTSEQISGEAVERGNAFARNAMGEKPVDSGDNSHG